MDPKRDREKAVEILERIIKQRANIVAPVDTMGCAALPKAKSAKLRRFQLLVSLLLSSQTRDETTAKAFTNLEDGLPQDPAREGERGLTPRNVLEADEAHINSLIRRVGFHNKKARDMKKIAEMVCKAGDIPRSVHGLLELPGIGPKMAYLAMQHAWHKNEGIGVDTHVHRLSNRLGLVATKTPEQTRKALEALFPRKYWPQINGALVGLGQTTCTATSPRCENCSAAKDYPPAGLK